MHWLKKKHNKLVTVSPVTADVDKLRYMAANLQGKGARARQEDSFTLANVLDDKQYEKNGLMFAVCDGMGGMKDGKAASETAATSLRNTFMNLDRNSEIIAQMKEGIYQASDKIFAALDGDGGSTAICSVILHECLYFVSVGDSFLYLFRNGSLIKLNAIHNVCHQRYLENIREGRLDAAECRNDPEAHALTSFLGMAGDLTIDSSVRPLPLMKGDVLLACSDGVGGVLNEKELKTALDCPSVHQICKNIEQSIIGHSAVNQDNYTALIIQCV